MSKKGSFWIFLTILLTCSCRENKTRLEIINPYSKVYEFSKYESVYNQATDSINYWLADSLAATKQMFFKTWHLDSCIYFNEDSTRLLATILCHSKFKDAVADYIDELGGAKINQQWYFFFLKVYHPILRENYQDSIYLPLTFSELSQIAREKILAMAIITDSNGVTTPNEEFFYQTFYNIFDCKNATDKIRCSDSLVLDIIGGKYQYKLDKKEIEEINLEIANSVKPAEPQPKQLSWWEKQFYEKPKKRFD